MKKIYTKLKKKPTSFSLEIKVLKALNKIAKNLKISRSQVVSKLIQEFDKIHSDL